MNKFAKKMLVLIIISLGVGFLGCLIVYKILPQYLCCVVQDVHSSNLYQGKNMPVKDLECAEYFVPQQYSYLKNVNLYMVPDAETADGGDESDSRFYLYVNLFDEDGKNLVKDKKIFLSVEKEEFLEIPVEKWVVPGKEYKFIIRFPECDRLNIRSGYGDIGPAEHQKLEINGVETEEALYMEYVYGGYSKKLLVFWFLVFFTLACILAEEMLYPCHVGESS